MLELDSPFLENNYSRRCLVYLWLHPLCIRMDPCNPEHPNIPSRPYQPPLVPLDTNPTLRKSRKYPPFATRH